MAGLKIKVEWSGLNSVGGRSLDSTDDPVSVTTVITNTFLLSPFRKLFWLLFRNTLILVIWQPNRPATRCWAPDEQEEKRTPEATKQTCE